MSHDNAEKSLLLSSVDAINDNMQEQITDLEQQACRFEAKIDATPYIDYHNTKTEISIPPEQINNDKDSLARQAHYIQEALEQAEDMIAAHTKITETKFELRETRNTLKQQYQHVSNYLEQLHRTVENQDYAEEPGTPV